MFYFNFINLFNFEALIVNYQLNLTHMKPKVTALLLCALLTACSTEFKIVSSDVPQPVIASFQQKYPAAQNTEWEAEKVDGHLTFEAEFKLDGKEKEAYFKPDGTFLKEE